MTAQLASGSTLQIDLKAPKKRTRVKVTSPDYPMLLPRDQWGVDELHPGFENMDNMLHLHELVCSS